MAAAKQDFDRLMRQANVKLIGASDAGIKGELYDVFQEFFNDSSVWLENINFTIIAGTVDYDVAPVEGQVIRLAGVVDTNGVPQPALMPTLGTIALRDMPSASGAVFTATVIKNVVLPTTRDQTPIVADFVLPKYHNTILDGVLGRMMSHMGKSYFSEQLSVYHLRRFRDGIARARVEVLRRNTMGAQAWAFPQTFRSRGQRGGVSTGSPRF